MIAEDAEEFQVVESKCKKVTSEDEKRHWPPKKAKEKYYGIATVKIEGFNLYERYVCTRQDCLIYHSRSVTIIIIIIF